MTNQTWPVAVIIAGPTCSGKSALAMDLSTRIDGTVINADSMQIYAELRVLTARPSPDDEARVPHALYGVRKAAEPGNVAWWRAAALEAMAVARAAGRVPVLTGGTGLYFTALTQGLAAIPDCGVAARAEARALLAAEGATALHARLATADPDAAATLSPRDGQRIARAWEVWRGTGRSILAWQRAVGSACGPPSWRFVSVWLDPPRVCLRAAITARFAAMLAAGAIEETRALIALGLDSALPAMRAHGVPELRAYLAGEITLEVAAQRTMLATSRYTKRQTTWFRHHDTADHTHARVIHARYDGNTQFSSVFNPGDFAFIKNQG